MSARTTHVGRDVAGIDPRVLVRWIPALWRAYRKHRAESISIAHLRAMDDHMLKDIGVSRGEIRYIVMTGKQPE